MFKPPEAIPDFPKIEENILEFWKKNKIFEKSITSRPADKPWTFLDGPPFVTGVPHYGSLLSSLPKDLFGRYWTMKGYRVRRVWGWDGHGLPVENKVEGKLGIKRKKDIEEKVGVKKFIDECKKYVEHTSGEWEWYIDRIGRWVDFKNAYKTWDLNYMESVMWVFKNLYEKGYVYKGLRVSLYCPHCATPISNFEVAMDADNYREMTDPSTTYKYELEGEKNTYLLAWSTTPWNKLATTALAVNPKLTYVKVKQGDEHYILAKSTLKMLKDKPAHKIVDTFKGDKLAGKKFVAHYDFYPIEKGKKAYVVVPGDFVTADEGTGVVTIAAYGEEDMRAMAEHNIQVVLHVDEEGIIKDIVRGFGGKYYLDVNPLVDADLEKRGLLYEKKEYIHSVPTCWRCHTRLYYAPQDAWFVNVQRLKPRMKETNEVINWFPSHFKYGRFLKSMENAPDWNISRNRYWGSPIPVWECQCGEHFVPGSIKELEEASGKMITDLHKPAIDEVTITCKKCGKKAHRVPEVLDSWIESGSASFAERHYPFATSSLRASPKGTISQGKPQRLEDFFPPDFIAEYTGQIRAWFYVLHVIGTALYDRPAFKNVLVEGVILGTDGRKMSKNYGNYPDPKEMLQKYGGDALRLYLMGSPVMKGEDILISEEAYRNQVKDILLILWNIYKFFMTYANNENWRPSGNFAKPEFKNELDRWIISQLNSLVGDVTGLLDEYNTADAISRIKTFIEIFSTRYIRRSRDRVRPSATSNEDKNAFFATCYTTLVDLSKILAPIAPFISEEIFKNLTGEESVHLSSWPKQNQRLIDTALEEAMKYAWEIIEAGHSQRKEAKIKVRQPLAKLSATAPVPLEKLHSILADELNVKKVVTEKRKDVSVALDLHLTPELLKEGEAREIIRQIQNERKKLGTAVNEEVDIEISSWPPEFEDLIKARALVDKLIKGNTFRVIRH